MPTPSIGDRSFSFQSIRQTTQLKTQLQDLGAALSSGERTDLPRAVGPNQRLLSQLDQDLARLSAFDRTTTFVEQRLVTLQAAVGGVDSLRRDLVDHTLLPSSNPSVADLREASEEAETIFGSLISTLNTRAAGRSLFAGQLVDGPAVAPAADMLATLRTLVAGATTQAELTRRVSDYFDDPAGGFLTAAYLGDTGPATNAALSDTRNIELSVDATDPALRKMLKVTAISSLIADAGAGLNMAEQQETLKAMGVEAISASSGLATLQARIGSAEARTAEARVENIAARTAFGIARNSLTTADPFETATRLQQVQQSLELHFAATARLSQLSLANYL